MHRYNTNSNFLERSPYSIAIVCKVPLYSRKINTCVHNISPKKRSKSYSGIMQLVLFKKTFCNLSLATKNRLISTEHTIVNIIHKFEIRLRRHNF